MEPFSLSSAALLVVDAQRGFSPLCPAELPVPDALSIVEPINRLLDLRWCRVDATQDWHPPDHRSFLGRKDNLYPPHCVMGSPGAEFLPGLRSERFHAIWRKGFDPDFEAYAVTAQHPAFAQVLLASGVKLVFVCGLARNICVFYSARDLRLAGLDVCIVDDASAGIDVPQAGLLQEKARAEALHLGIRYVFTADVLAAARSD
ncbi:MAG: nicotinamidase [Gemmataceae bacterium]